ncbi:hypothetical protein CERZMDRAFT_100964 [Cercospora zeae-maydis SCOH1-5]|uniref:Hydrophobin n=1 Tax=Cercospora zeae-maydis SCOH1-5 TaxID=717836 RepID=A0A6A6F5E8_9PEZI|nr:hypothetical protein CERZMDRAFT_100964 [Cercospora zeae-maydis SCOH1-5]
MSSSSILLALAYSSLALALPQASYNRQEPMQCTDGGQLHCCQATFTGAALPVALASDLLCYDLTPAVVNCVITAAPSDPDTGCYGTPLCCQVNALTPAIGLFCSKPPGNCVRREANGRCIDVLTDRFGNCTESDINRQRGDLGLGVLGDVAEQVAGGPVGGAVKGVTGPVGGVVNGVTKPVAGVVNPVLGSLRGSGPLSGLLGS